MRIDRPDNFDEVLRGADLFDNPPRPDATSSFLTNPMNHLLFAYADSDDAVLGFVSGIESGHPDKGTEMLVYELSVDEAHRGKGIGAALVDAIAGVARTRGCVGMWVAVDQENEAAHATYRRAGAQGEETCVIHSWTFASS